MEAQLIEVISQELTLAGFRTLEDLKRMENAGEHLVHPSRMAEYEVVDGVDLTELNGIVRDLTDTFDGYSNLMLKGSVSLPAVSIDIKTHNGSLFVAVYFAKNKNIEQVCLNSGYEFSVKKGIWFKKCALDSEKLIDIANASKNLLGGFLNELRKACSVVIVKKNSNKFYLSKREW